MTLPSLVGAVDGWCDNTAPDPRWWRTTLGRDRRQPDVARRTVGSWPTARSLPGQLHLQSALPRPAGEAPRGGHAGCGTGVGTDLR